MTEGLGSQEIRKYQENLNTLQKDSLVPSLPPKFKILSILAKNFSKYTLDFSRSVLFHMNIRVYLKYFVHGCI